MPVDGEKHGAQEYHTCPLCGKGRWDTKGHWNQRKNGYICVQCLNQKLKLNSKSAKKGVASGKTKSILVGKFQLQRSIQQRDKAYREEGKWKCRKGKAHSWKEYKPPKNGKIFFRCSKCRNKKTLPLEPVVAGTYQESKLPIAEEWT